MTSDPPPTLHTILVVDDDPLYLRVMVRLLRDPAFAVLAAAGSDDALALAATHPGPIDLLLTDVVLPGVSGPALAARLREQTPAMRVLFMSGYGVEILAKHGVDGGAEVFFTKPISQVALRERVTRLLEPP